MRTFILIICSFSALFLSAQTALHQSPILTFLGPLSQEFSMINEGVLPYDGLGQPLLLTSKNTLHNRAFTISASPILGAAEGFGLLNAPEAGNQHSWVGISGSHRGHLDGGGLLKFASKENQWKNATVFNFQQLQTQLDKNEDSFLDLPTYRRWFVNHKASFTTNRFSVSLAGTYLNYKDESGQMHKHPEQIGDMNLWQIDQQQTHWKGLLSANYFFDHNRKKQLKAKFSIRQQEQNHTLGKRPFAATEQLTEGSLTYRHEGIASIFEAKTYFQQRETNYTFDQFSIQQEPNIIGFSLASKKLMAGKFYWKNTLAIEHHAALGWQIKPVLRLDYLHSNKWKLGLYAGRDYRWVNLSVIQNPYWISNRSTYLNGQTDFSEKAIYTGLNLKSYALHIAGYQISTSLNYDYRNYQQFVFVDTWSDSNTVNIRSSKEAASRHQVLAAARLNLNRHWRINGHYRFTHAKQTIGSQKKTVPFMSPHSFYGSIKIRDFFIETLNVQFDYVASSPMNMGTQAATKSPWRHQANLFIEVDYWPNRRDKMGYRFFAGAENLFSQRQQNVFNNPDAPWEDNFNADERWGSVIGTRLFVGAKVLW